MLVFSAPRAPLAQPYNVVVGSILSAIVGVTVRKACGDRVLLAAPLAVAFAIVVRLLARALHPPGGATALLAVVGSSEVLASGYMYAIFPAFISSVLFVSLALLTNNLSRDPANAYPAYWHPFTSPAKPPAPAPLVLPLTCDVIVLAARCTAESEHPHLAGSALPDPEKATDIRAPPWQISVAAV